jgi:hypothetical protein
MILDYGGSFEDVNEENKLNDKSGFVIGQPCTLVVISRKVVKACMVVEENDLQWENIFYSKCQIQQRPCSMIIKGGG